MKKNIFIFVGLWLTALTASAQYTLEADTIDLGQTMFRDSVPAVFKFVNTGRIPLFINKVDASCGCTTVDYPKIAVKPKKPFEITVTYDAMQLGHYCKWVDVYLDDNPEPLRLTIMGEIISPRKPFVGRRRFSQEYKDSVAEANAPKPVPVVVKEDKATTDKKKKKKKKKSEQ